MKKFIALLVLKFKNLTFFRILIKPIIENKRKRQLKKYIKSDDSKKIKNLKNRFLGERCFIIGNGPSLTIEDLEKLQKEYTFAANSIYKVFDKTVWRPTFYTCIDSVSYQLFGDELLKMDTEYKFFDVNEKKYFRKQSVPDSVYFLFQKYRFKIHRWDYEEPQVSEEINEGVSLGYTVTFTAIQLAIFLGFKEIYLIGVDHNYSKQIDSSGKVTEDKNKNSYSSVIGDNGMGIQYTDITSAAYRSCYEYAKNHNIVIKNATRGGKLEVFERIDFDNIINNEK